MKYPKVLVTGGAGFIGSHLVDGLITKGYKVRVMDNLYKQIHPQGKLPAYLNRKAQFFKGDVTRHNDWHEALRGIDAVFHFASAVGVGQSMYEIEHYVKVNSLGTAIFLDYLANRKHTVKKIIVAASMSSYGEGLYECGHCKIIKADLRETGRLMLKDYAVYCPRCGRKTSRAVATREDTRQDSNSIYAIGKKNQEEMVLTFGKAYSIPSVALRFFNVYGPRQSLSNPYNGVVAIFLSRIKNKKPPLINEDGSQSRDFIHVNDVVGINILSLEKKEADYQVFNVGSGKPISIEEIASILIRLNNSNLKPLISGKVRKLDVKHCFADISKAKRLLGWTPQVNLRKGLEEVIRWSAKEKAVDKLEKSLVELEKRGLR